MSNIANLFKIIEEIGSDKQYGNEKVSQFEHAIQCALLAKKNNESLSISRAALQKDSKPIIDRNSGS